MYEFAIQCKIKNGSPFIMYKYSNFNELVSFLPILIDSKKKFGVVIENSEYQYLGNNNGDYHLTILKRYVDNYEVV